MRKPIHFFTFILTVIVLSFVLPALSAQEAPATAYVRIAHYAQGVGAVDAYVDGALTDVIGLEFGAASAWIELPAGSYQFAVGPTGSGEAPFSVRTRVQAGEWTTIAAVMSSDGRRPTLIKIIEVARVRVAHLAQGVPAVDVFADGELSGVQNLSFGNISEWVELAPGAHRFAVGPTGSGEAPFLITTNLAAGSWTNIVALGSADGERVTLRKVVEDFSPVGKDRTRVTVFHGIPGVQPVNLQLADGTVLIGGVGYPGSLGNNDGADDVVVGTGDYDLAVTPTSDPTTTLFELSDRRLASARQYFIAAYGLLPNAQLLVASTDVSGLPGR